LRDHIRNNNLNEEDFPILANVPELLPGLKWIWEGFHALSASRQHGMGGVQPLMMQEITAYINFKEYEGEDKHEFLHFIQFMDGILVKEISSRKPTPPPRPPGR
jgi:hypothetical protein